MCRCVIEHIPSCTCAYFGEVFYGNFQKRAPLNQKIRTRRADHRPTGSCIDVVIRWPRRSVVVARYDASFDCSLTALASVCRALAVPSTHRPDRRTHRCTARRSVHRSICQATDAGRHTRPAAVRLSIDSFAGPSDATRSVSCTDAGRHAGPSVYLAGLRLFHSRARSFLECVSEREGTIRVAEELKNCIDGCSTYGACMNDVTENISFIFLYCFLRPARSEGPSVPPRPARAPPIRFRRSAFVPSVRPSVRRACPAGLYACVPAGRRCRRTEGKSGRSVG